MTTRLEEARTDFARLLLAKHMLEAAIATWESKRQPEVYLRASRLLSLMTEGRWTRVSLTREGTLEVADALGRTRQPVHLSLGTCQQLYLALRIALLTCADNVGRAIPILADDILVNFDEQRRLGARPRFGGTIGAAPGHSLHLPRRRGPSLEEGCKAVRTPGDGDQLIG